MSWNDERVELLKKLWIDGMSASQIATSLGEVTRNAVIGKIHRLGLSNRARPGAAVAAAAAAPAVAQSRPKPKMQPAAAAAMAASAVAPQRTMRPAAATIGNTALKAEPVYLVEAEPEKLPTTASVVVIDERVTIMMLTEQSCRWPIGDPGSEGFSFCGKRSETGIPYCTHHARIAYQPVERRRDRRSGH